MKPSIAWMLGLVIAACRPTSPVPQRPITPNEGARAAAHEPLPMGPLPPQPPTESALAEARQTMPPPSEEDFANATRGRIAPFSGEIHDARGKVVWNIGAYAFEQSEAPPPTVHPSLWRQAQLNGNAGLFEVTEGIYQLRGFDVANMDIIEGEHGILVVDPLTSMETARAALDFYYEHRPRKPIVAVIYTHSHVDHFGGVKGIVSEDDVRAGRVEILAPEGFLEHAVSENIYAGTAMSRRAEYMYGVTLPRDPRGNVDIGIGKSPSLGTISLIAPTDTIERTGERRVFAGVEVVFQLTPGTEAPAEMNLYFPAQRALCAAENATHTMHNLMTLRGAEVRDPAAWAHYLNEAIDLFGDKTDVVFVQHTWPTWGRREVVQMLADQRDMYQYIHDQALHLINEGKTPMEIAEAMQTLPPGLAERWYTQGYYGSLSHNVRAVYQKYMGFYDGNPAHLDPLPPVEAARRYVEYMGGADAILARAREAFERGEYRWVAQVVNHVVFAEPDRLEARRLQAAALEQMGYQTLNSTWRNSFLTGAQELRHGISDLPITTVSPEVVSAMPVGMFFRYFGVRLDKDRAADQTMVINWIFTDIDQRYALTLRNGALTYLADRQAERADATVRTTKATLDAIATRRTRLEDAIASGALLITGDPTSLPRLFAMMDHFPPMFPIVTP